MRVCTVIGTRPEVIKLSRVMATLDKSVEHIVIHTGQNYDRRLNAIFFDEMQLRNPDQVLDTAKENSIQTVAGMMRALDKVFDEIEPEALLILGDTNSCVAAAYTAKRKQIPIFHMEAGNRCFDERVPEEANRRIIDHISDINLPYSLIARENLLREGFPSDRIIKTGSPMAEVLGYYQTQIEESSVDKRLGLKKGEYFLVSCHRAENVDSPERLHQFLMLLNTVAEKYGQRVIVSTHPRIRKKLMLESATDPYDVIGYQQFARPEIEFYTPFGFFDYVHLQEGARCVLSDSGTITEESSILGFPAINLREAHERPEGMEEASVIMTGFNPVRVLESISMAQFPMHTPADYEAVRVSDKIVRIILSYTDYVNRVVWRKNV